MIVEKSAIISNGLSTLLTAKNNTPLSIERCDSECEIQSTVFKFSPDVLIATPQIFEQNEKLIHSLKEKHQMLLVGLIYSFQHPDSLTHLDGLIYINDSTEKIQAMINGIIKSNATKNNTGPSEALTSREEEILKLLVGGNTTKQIANTLHISTHTVNAHRKNIMRKLDIKTISGLTIYAVLNNLITLKEA